MISTSITTIEADGQHWVRIDIDNQALPRRGPYRSSFEAEAAAAGFAARCRALLQQPVNVGTAATAPPHTSAR